MTDLESPAVTAPHRFIGFLEQGETPSAIELNLVSSGKATLRFCVGNEETQSRVFVESINWARVILAKDNGATVGFLSFFQDGYGPFNADKEKFIQEFGAVSGTLRFWLYKAMEKRCTRPECYVYKLAVVDGMRSSGIGSAMMEFLVSHAGEKKLGSIELDVFEKNTKAAELYASLGFAKVNEVNLRIFGRFFPHAKIIRMKKPVEAL